MTSSSRLLKEFARICGPAGDPGFTLILAFDYYDGPEHGLALYPSGCGVRFSSLGDSNSRLFRSFELIPIDGNWWPQIRALQQVEGGGPPRRILLPSGGSDALTELQSEILSASAVEQFVSVGSPNLEKISISPVTQEQLQELRKLGCSPAGFKRAHRIIKGRRAAG
jgi:hypothetical protein